MPRLVTTTEERDLDAALLSIRDEATDALSKRLSKEVQTISSGNNSPLQDIRINCFIYEFTLYNKTYDKTIAIKMYTETPYELPDLSSREVLWGELVNPTYEGDRVYPAIIPNFWYQNIEVVSDNGVGHINNFWVAISAKRIYVAAENQVYSENGWKLFNIDMDTDEQTVAIRGISGNYVAAEEVNRATGIISLAIYRFESFGNKPTLTRINGVNTNSTDVGTFFKIQHYHNQVILMYQRVIAGAGTATQLEFTYIHNVYDDYWGNVCDPFFASGWNSAIQITEITHYCLSPDSVVSLVTATGIINDDRETTYRNPAFAHEWRPIMNRRIMHEVNFYTIETLATMNYWTGLIYDEEHNKMVALGSNMVVLIIPPIIFYWEQFIEFPTQPGRSVGFPETFYITKFYAPDARHLGKNRVQLPTHEGGYNLGTFACEFVDEMDQKIWSGIIYYDGNGTDVMNYKGPISIRPVNYNTNNLTSYNDFFKPESASIICNPTTLYLVINIFNGEGKRAPPFDSEPWLGVGFITYDLSQKVPFYGVPTFSFTANRIAGTTSWNHLLNDPFTETGWINWNEMVLTSYNEIGI